MTDVIYTHNIAAGDTVLVRSENGAQEYIAEHDPDFPAFRLVLRNIITERIEFVENLDTLEMERI